MRVLLSPGVGSGKETHLHRTHPSLHFWRALAGPLAAWPQLPAAAEETMSDKFPIQPSPSPTWGLPFLTLLTDTFPDRDFPQHIVGMWSVHDNLSDSCRGPGSLGWASWPAHSWIEAWAASTLEEQCGLGKSYMPRPRFFWLENRITLAFSASTEVRGLVNYGTTWREGQKWPLQWFLPASAIVRHTCAHTPVFLASSLLFPSQLDFFL